VNLKQKNFIGPIIHAHLFHLDMKSNERGQNDSVVSSCDNDGLGFYFELNNGPAIYMIQQLLSLI
jgi:hypothetical protein